jgi:hypothetical protein
VSQTLSRIGRFLGPKLLALLLALAVFTYARLGADREGRLRVPLEIRNLPANLVLVGDPPRSIDLRVRGQGMDFLKLRMERARAVLDLRDARPGRVQHRLGPADLMLTGDVQPEVTEVLSPRMITLDVDTVVTRRLPVRLALVGDLPAGLGFVSPLRPDPAEVRVTGPSEVLDNMESVGTESLWLDKLRGSVRAMLRVHSERKGVRVFPDSVAVEVDLEQVESRRLPPVPVVVVGAAADLIAHVEPESAAVTVSVPPDRSDAAISREVKVFVDATDLPPGRHLLTAQVDLLSPELRLEGVQPGRFLVELAHPGP